MITVYVGDAGPYLPELARSIDNGAKLVTAENYKQLEPGLYYTSLAELGELTTLGHVLNCADQIVYAPPPDLKWSDCRYYSNSSQLQRWTEEYLKIFSFRKCVKNFSIPEPADKSVMLELADSRKVNTKQLWIAGCSISHGVGVEPNQRYGQLLSDNLNLPATFLTRTGASNIWIADQILRSDIQQDDLVIWGITSTPRVPWFHNGKLSNVVPLSFEAKTADDFSFEYFISDDIIYRTVVAIFQTINYCKKIGAKLLLVSLFDNGTMFKYLKDSPNLLQIHGIWGKDLNNTYIDLGNDLLHPGYKTHQFYADDILKKLKQLEWI